MTRAEILASYNVDEHGIILSPGKFQCEMLYVPYLWDAVLNGEGEILDACGRESTLLLIDDADRAEFPELTDSQAAELAESAAGFVFCCTFDHVPEIDDLV